MNQEFKDSLITAYNELKAIDEDKINDWDQVNRVRSAKDALGKYVSDSGEVREPDFNSSEYYKGKYEALKEEKESLERYIGTLKQDLKTAFRAMGEVWNKYNL